MDHSVPCLQSTSKNPAIHKLSLPPYKVLEELDDSWTSVYTFSGKLSSSILKMLEPKWLVSAYGSCYIVK